MKLRHIELVHAILQSGSLSAAARLLDISQPSATRALQHAEHQLGYALFTRRGGRLQPTEQMELLAPAVRQAVDGLDSARRTALNLRTQVGASVRVGIMLSIASALPEAWQRWTAGRPPGEAARCEFSTGHFETLLEWLLLHEIDLAIALEPPGHPALQPIDLGRRRLVCAARPELLGKFGRSRQVQAQDLRTMPLIEIIASDPVGRMVASYAERYDWPYPAPIAVKTHQVALDFAARGLGVAVVDDLSASRYAPTLSILRVEPAATLGVKGLWLKSRPLSQAAQRFADAFREALESG
jgi:DNA-binding transcriptional LysR family regulator